MTHTVGGPTTEGDHYVKDVDGHIIGCVWRAGEVRGTWAWQSCFRHPIPGRSSWSDAGYAPTREEAIAAAVADYVARRME